MTQQVNALFENGVLTPVTAVNLKEQERVVLSIQSVTSEPSGANDNSLLDGLQEVEFVGSAHSTPHDLSHNPEYSMGLTQSAARPTTLRLKMSSADATYAQATGTAIDACRDFKTADKWLQNNDLRRIHCATRGFRK